MGKYIGKLAFFLLLSLRVASPWLPESFAEDLPIGPSSIEDGSYDVGSHPWEVVNGDFDNDGDEDLAVNATIENMVEILLGNGDGTFQNSVGYWAGYKPMSLVADDFDEDGNLDLAVSSTDSDLVVVLHGFGDGTFGDSLVLPSGDFPVNIASHDVNKDGHVDLCSSNSYDNTIAIYLGDGNGNFTSPLFYTITGGPRAPEFGDFNEDGNPDIVVTLRGAINQLGIMFGDGTGAFSSTMTIEIGTYPRRSAVRDFNGDGHLDIAVALRGDNSANIIFGDGTGSFSPPVVYDVGVGPRWLTAGDIDGDGIQDLVTTNFFGETITILLGDEIGEFPYRVDFDIGSGPRGMTIGDFDSDENPDLAIVLFGEDRLSIVLDSKDDVTPFLISPADGDTITADPLFRWKDVPGANAYQLVLYENGNELLWSKFIQGRSEYLYDGPGLLSPGVNYMWSVRERVQNEWNQLAPSLSFQKAAPETVLVGPSLNLPPNGATIALAELFSWSVLEGASKYEIYVYDDSATTVLLYQGSSEGNSHFIPQGILGLTEPKDYYWRVRGVDEWGYAGEFSELRQFILSDFVSPPPPPVLVQPSESDTVKQTEVDFIWLPSAGATHYTLEFSRDSLFTPSSEMTWTAERITDTLYTAQMREGVSTMYWHVKGLNNGGESPWSSAGEFEYDSGMVPPVNSVEIIDPVYGTEIEIGTSIVPFGVVSGSHSGIIEGIWLLNNVTIDSFSVSMDPTQGVSLQGPVIQVVETGSDTLVLTVTSPDSVSSDPVVYDKVIPSTGSVSAIHLVASPFAIPADSQSQSTITAYMVDGEGRRVYTDYARLVSFVVLGEGFPVTPTSSLTDSGAARLIVRSTKTPDEDVIVFAYSTGITGAYTYFMTYDEDLEEYVTRTLAHIDRLETLPLDYYPDRLDTALAGYDLSNIWEFLNQEILGVPDPSPESVESLRRMMLALKYIDMCYYYEHDPLFPEEDEQPVRGTGFFMDQIAGPTSGGAIVSNFLSHMADTIIQRSTASSTMQRVAHSLYRGSQHMFECLYSPTLERASDTDMMGLVFQALKTSHREAASLARDNEDPLTLFEDYTIRLNRQLELINNYISDTQYLIDDVASMAQAHSYSSTFEESRERIDELLTETRSITHTALLESESLDASNALLASCGELSLLGESVSEGLEAPFLAGKLVETSEYVFYPERWTGVGETVPLALQTLDDLVTRLLPDGTFAAFGFESPQNAAGGRYNLQPLAPERIEDMLLLLSEKGLDFESSARGILTSLSNDDSASVSEGLPELCDVGDELFELMYVLRATFGSFSISGPASIGNYDRLYEDMNEVYFGQSGGIMNFELTLFNYLYNRQFEQSKQLAVQAGTDAIAQVNDAIRKYTEIIPSFFDLPALPSLVPSGLDFPDSVGPAHIFSINATLLNMGSGDEGNVSVFLTFDGPFELLSSDSIFVSSVSPGDSAQLSWQLRVRSPAHPQLEIGLFPFSIEVRSTGSIAYPRFFLIRVYKKSFGVNYAAVKKVPESDVRLRSLPKTFNLYQNCPNPFNPQTRISFDIPEGETQRVSLKVYDVRGKLLTTLVDEVKGAGSYTVLWDGTDQRGRKLGTGIYFYVIDTGSFRSVRKMLLRK